MADTNLSKLIELAREAGYEIEYKYKSKRLESHRNSYEAQEVTIDSIQSIKQDDIDGDILFYRIKTLDGIKGFFINQSGTGAHLEAAQFLTQTQKDQSALKDMNNSNN